MFVFKVFSCFKIFFISVCRSEFFGGIFGVVRGGDGFSLYIVKVFVFLGFRFTRDE